MDFDLYDVNLDDFDSIDYSEYYEEDYSRDYWREELYEAVH